jgi:hypothetical protein
MGVRINIDEKLEIKAHTKLVINPHQKDVVKSFF